jgi:hypothetical protein
MTHSVRLPALIGSHPLGALASFGLLRLVSSWDREAKLHFVMEDDWVAILDTKRFASVPALIRALDEWLKSGTLQRMLAWAKDVRIEPGVYRELLSRSMREGDADLYGFLSAVVADGAVDTTKKLVKPSAFYMVSGQQSFLAGLREILDLAEAATSVFDEALSGPWRYATPAHSLGWDPHTERLYALRHKAPTVDKPSCVAGAILLAFWAIALMPAFANAGRPMTIGFVRSRRDHYFSWPVFSTPIDLPELTSFLQAGPRSWVAYGKRRLRSGIEAVYESSRAEFGQGYAVFRPARLAETGMARSRFERRSSHGPRR